MNIAVLFHAARFKDESQGQYHDRRRLQKDRLKRISFAHISARILPLPPKGENLQIDISILNGLIRHVQDTGRFDAKGRMLRLGVERGKTFEYPEGRQAHREAVRYARKHPGVPFHSALSNSTCPRVVAA